MRILCAVRTSGFILTIAVMCPFYGTERGKFVKAKRGPRKGPLEARSLRGAPLLGEEAILFEVLLGDVGRVFLLDVHGGVKLLHRTQV